MTVHKMTVSWDECVNLHYCVSSLCVESLSVCRILVRLRPDMEVSFHVGKCTSKIVVLVGH